MSLSAAAVGYCVVGGLVLLSGIKGATIGDTLKASLSGDLGVLDNTEPITVSDAGDDPSTSGTVIPASSSAIVNDAAKYVGDKYIYGGTPGAEIGVNNGTDCSGFVNMVVGRDLGLSIPGFAAGQYSGSEHGPTTEVWLMWNGATTIPTSQAQPGDLACFLTHMGIFTDAGQHFVSALDTQSGVLVTTIAGGTPTGEELHVRRLVDA